MNFGLGFPDIMQILVSLALPSFFGIVMAGFLVWLYIQTRRRAALFLGAYHLIAPIFAVFSQVLLTRNLPIEQISVVFAMKAILLNLIQTGLTIWLLYSLVRWGRPTNVEQPSDR
jgi:hypothetical protein